MELKVKETDKETGDVLYEPVDVPVQKKYVADTGFVSFIFDELAPPVDGPSANGFCGMTKTMATKLQKTLAVIDKGSMVKVSLVDKKDTGYRNIVRIEPLDIGGEPIVSEQSTQEVTTRPVVANARTMGRVPPAWEMGVEYNNKKDNKICLNVACSNAVAMFGHVTELVGKLQPADDSELGKQYEETYKLAMHIIERLASLSVEKPEEPEEAEGEFAE